MKTILLFFLAASAAWGQSVYSGTWTESGSATWSANSGSTDTNVYVAPAAQGGSDSNPCTLTQPCLTPQRASTVVRGMSGGSHLVMFRGGNYFLSAPWTLNSGDSGTAATPISYQSYPGESAVVSGGRPVVSGAAGTIGNWLDLGLNFNSCGASCRGWKITLDADSAHSGYWLNTEGLFYNAERRYRPRANGGNYLRIADDCFADTSAGGVNGQDYVQQSCKDASGVTQPYIYFNRFHYKATDALPSSYYGQARGDVEVLDFQKMTMSTMRISSIDTVNKVVVLTGSTFPDPLFHGFLANHRYLIENVKESLSQAGQWYLDRCNPTCSSKAWDLYYLADESKGENPTTAEVVLTQQPSVLVATGTHDVTFSGITFAHDNWLVGTAGLGSTQGMPDVPAAVSFVGTTNVTLDGVTVRNTQGWGVEFHSAGTSSKNNKVINSRLYDIGAGAIRIGNMPCLSAGQQMHNCTAIADTELNVTQSNVVTNNLIIYGGRKDPTGNGSGVWIGNSHHNSVTHNEIAYFYAGGVSVGYNYGYENKDGSLKCPTANAAPRCLAHDNDVEYNWIYEMGRGVMDDFGGYYSAPGNATGNVFSHNKVTDITEAISDSDGYNGVGIYFDQGSTGIVAQYNLVARVSHLCINNNLSERDDDIYPQNNLIDNNILVDCGTTHTSNANHRPAVIQRNGNNPSSFTFSHNIVSVDLSTTKMMEFPGLWGCFANDGVTAVPCTQRWNQNHNLWWNRAAGHSLANSFVTCRTGACPATPTCWNGTSGNYNCMDLGTYQGAPYNEEPGALSFDPLFRMSGADDYVPTADLTALGFTGFDPSQAGRTSNSMSAPAQGDAFPVSLLDPQNDWGTPVSADRSNLYCGPGDAARFGTADGPAQLPTACTYTAMTGTPSPGTTLTATSCSDFATKLAAIQGGQTLVVPSTLSCTGSYTLPAAPGASASNWVTIRTDQINAAGFPGEGTRATPCQTNVASLAGRPAYSCSSPSRLMPLLQCGTVNCAVITAGSGAAFYRLIGLEITSTTKSNNYIVTLGGGDHIILDRMVIHSPDNPTFSPTLEVKGGVQVNGTTHWAVIDSYLWGFMCVSGGACSDSQAIAGGNGSVVAGPGKMTNNFLEAAGENYIFGGGTSTVAPTDFEIRGNHMFKPLTWFMPVGGSANPYPMIKNNGELKNAIRVLEEGNIYENDWSGFQGDQFGTAVLRTPKNQSSYTSGTVNTSTNTLTATSGSFPSNVTRVRIGSNTWYTVTNWVSSTVVNVTPDPGSGTGLSATRICQPGLAPNAIVQDVTFRYNLIEHAANGMGVSTAMSDCLDQSQGIHNISIHDVLMDDINGPAYSNATTACCNGGWGIKVGNDHPQSTAWPSNITINHNSMVGVGFNGGKLTGTGFLSGNTQSFQDYFVNFVVTNNVGPAPYGIFYDGTSTLTPITTGLNQLGCPSHDGQNCTWTFSKNLAVSGVWTGQSNNAPYPGTCGTGGETCNPSGGFAGIFANYNNGSGGDYHLVAGPYKAAATDGKDLGADIDLVLQNTSNAQ